MSFYSSSNVNTERDQDVCVKSKETQQHMKQNFTPKKSLSRISNLHKNIRSALPKEMVEKIKVIISILNSTKYHLKLMILCDIRHLHIRKEFQ